MDFSLYQAFSIMITLTVSIMLLIALSKFLSVTSQQSEKATVMDSQLPVQTVNAAVMGTENPKLTVKSSIKIKISAFNQNSTQDEFLAKIKEYSDCSAKDTDGNTIDSNKIILKLDNDDKDNYKYFIQKGGVIRVKYSVEDSKGRKTSVIKNVILQKTDSTVGNVSGESDTSGHSLSEDDINNIDNNNDNNVSSDIEEVNNNENENEENKVPKVVFNETSENSDNS